MAAMPVPPDDTPKSVYESPSQDSAGQGIAMSRTRRLAKPLEITHSWAPDREAMAAALRVVLGLPRQMPEARSSEGR